jgi:hypothetical protein
MKDLFGTAASAVQAESTGPAELPTGKWFAARTSDRGGASPTIVMGKDDQPFLFKTGLYAVGGDGKTVTEKMYGAYTFFQAFIRPNYKEQGGPQSQADYDALNGRLVGFMNTLLSPGIEDKEARWNNTLSRLGAFAGLLKDESDPDKHLEPAMFAVTLGDGSTGQDNAHYMVRVFTMLLLDQPGLAIVNQKLDKGRNGDRNDLVVGSYKDATVANSKTTNGQLVMFTSREGEVFAFVDPASNGGGSDVTAF